MEREERGDRGGGNLTEGERKKKKRERQKW